MIPLKIAEPTFNVKVSQEERDAAVETRQLFDAFLKDQVTLRSHLSVFFEELEETEDTSNMQKISPVLVKYIHKFRDLCNVYIKSLEKAVQFAATNFKDSDMNNIRDLIVESVRDIRNNSAELIRAFKSIDSDTFVADITALYTKIVERIDQLETSISEELFGHIDYNILGKIRLSFNQVPLSIKLGTSNNV